MTDDYQPRPADKFTFGLWTVGQTGRDPFGEATRPGFSAPYIVRKLAELGAYGVNLHDNDLVPIDATPQQRDRIVAEFKQALSDHGLALPMATTNLFSDPAFKDGAFTSADARVRAYALQKTMHSMDLGHELGAQTYVFWGGREGTEVDASSKLLDALAWFRDSLNFLAEYSQSQGYGYRFALEPKPNEPRGDLFFPTAGSMLGFIATLDQPDLFGVNPEFAHDTMAGLNFTHAVAQVIDAGKLFHIDLNDQKMGRFDQDLRFGAENLKTCFFLVKLLEDTGYSGPRHFDAHALRTEDEEGVWAFARGCMRTYLMLKEKARQFDEDPEIQAALQAYRVDDEELARLTAKFSPENAEALKNRTFDREALGRRGPGLEQLDQLTVELLLGLRGAVARA
ncbi:xylose isomerase (plasmid) [Deinococcus metallilatus]|uniref:Xylose isomerase n=1 Tax=Deinococcus metallilatus TaxID=1211322 RepID=A0AAJ5K1K3_9DEIO|nr:xylose isomerase [Deinococcus metallilatus]MBB5293486.1 xylose isomerase [Deinococcus metallilatus]QBY06568.1 xylose isomerase [Deinococcus metallilatus]RXJ17911.1 xylose isomerase [Deinococcus metallilatus]TLK32183.1 xylose isomerase [Deinococcus metallilatus]GMA15294.1 xylose isomerase [Deinococcus metallilatus]